METTNYSLSQKFSGGDFPAVYPWFTEDIEWQLIGSRIVKGKADVIEFCNNMLVEMEGAELTNDDVIEAAGRIVIEGKCRYRDADGKEAVVNYCDLYRFEQNKIKTITSYCI